MQHEKHGQVTKSLKEAANHIATLYHAHLAIAPPAIPLQAEQLLTDFIQAQHEFNQKLVEQLERMEQRQLERDQQLMKAIRETQVVKKQLAASLKILAFFGILLIVGANGFDIKGLLALMFISLFFIGKP